MVWDSELPPTVTGKLGDALGKAVTEGNQVHCPHPREDEPNSWRGLLTWNKRRDDVVVADSVFNKKGSVKRKITLKEWGRVLDFPECKTQQMSESGLQLLKQVEIPGKIFYSALYRLSKISTWGGAHPAG